MNRLLKQHRQMADVVKAMSRGGGKRHGRHDGGDGHGRRRGRSAPGITPPGGGMGKMGGALGGLGGGMGGMPDLDKLRALGGGKLPPRYGRASGGMPGMGAGFPGLPGLPKKK